MFSSLQGAFVIGTSVATSGVDCLLSGACRSDIHGLAAVIHSHAGPGWMVYLKLSLNALSEALVLLCY